MKKNIAVRYAINTMITGMLFAPIVLYNYFAGGHILTEDDLIAFFMLGWFIGWMLKTSVEVAISSSKEAVKTIDDVKNNYKAGKI